MKVSKSRYGSDCIMLFCAVLLSINGLLSSAYGQTGQYNSPQPTLGAPYLIKAGDTLIKLANQLYGDPMAWTAIMLATNERTINTSPNYMDALTPISDPNTIEVKDKIWLPDQNERVELETLYTDYLRSITDMMLPQPWEVDSTLVILPPDETVIMITWTTSKYYQDKTPPYVDSAYNDMWVTHAPDMKAFLKTLDPDAIDVTLRLEKRLGLPPRIGKDIFVEIELENPGQNIFRPTSDPKVDKMPGLFNENGFVEPDPADTAYMVWFYKQYHSSYSTAHPHQYSWTQLGYTFDWGKKDGGFVEFGESEFVIPKGTRYRVLSITKSLDYVKKSR